MRNISNEVKGKNNININESIFFLEFHNKQSLNAQCYYVWVPRNYFSPYFFFLVNSSSFYKCVRTLVDKCSCTDVRKKRQHTHTHIERITTIRANETIFNNRLKGRLKERRKTHQTKTKKNLTRKREKIQVEILLRWLNLLIFFQYRSPSHFSLTLSVSLSLAPFALSCRNKF